MSQYIRTRTEFQKSDHEVWMDHASQLENELNAAVNDKKKLAQRVDELERLINFDPTESGR